MSLRGLYPIVDTEALAARGLPLVPFAEQVLAARPPVLQLRAKSLGGRETLALLRALVPLARSAGTLLFANDRPDLALLAGADGVHVGQSDLPLAEVRRFAPSLKVGVSTHDESELQQALTEGPDYVAFGPVFSTRSKAAPEPTVGVERLASAAVLARRAGVPLVAIGGIDGARVEQAAAHADLVAVIAALLPASGALDEVCPRARDLAAVLAARAGAGD
jgi:thiamine-phosphate pyrophosphorylase